MHPSSKVRLARYGVNDQNRVYRWTCRMTEMEASLLLGGTDPEQPDGSWTRLRSGNY
jgi:hypothetical protein